MGATCARNLAGAVKIRSRDGLAQDPPLEMGLVCTTLNYSGSCKGIDIRHAWLAHWCVIASAAFNSVGVCECRWQRLRLGLGVVSAGRGGGLPSRASVGLKENPTAPPVAPPKP